MDMKILLLVVLCFSLFFGCAAKKAPAAEEEAVPEEPPKAPEEEEPEEPAPEEPSEDMEELADLFTVETDKPLEDEGFDVETPSSEE